MNVGEKWANSWQNKSFRILLIGGIGGLLAMVPFITGFFEYLEQRDGYQLNDFVLTSFNAYNVSVPTFLIIWSMIGFTLFRSIQYPETLLLVVWSYFLMLVGRTLTLLLVPLDPPAGLIELKDPLSTLYYGSKFMTKDLFFSGHTATLFIMGLSMKHTTDRWILIISSVLIGILVLVQHVHYTIDVIAAFIFGYLFYRIALLVTRNAITAS
jgi:membrane-associated phospholipid phosphatase